MKEFMALQSAFWFELFPTHITKVSFLCAVTIHVSFQVALAASGILTEGTFEGFDTWNKKKYTMKQAGCAFPWGWTFAWKKFQIMWTTWTKRNTSKFRALQIRNFISIFCVNDAELMRASLNLLRERRSSFTIKYCPTEGRYWV